MSDSAQVTRRSALVLGASAAVFAQATGLLAPATARADVAGSSLLGSAVQPAQTGQTSANGWALERAAGIGGSIWTRELQGTGGSYEVRLGDVEAVLTRLARRFHYEVGELRAGDVVGFQRVAAAGSSPESNHGSGTAIDILPGSYPVGVRPQMTAFQLRALRSILDDLGGVVAWGGDFSVPAPSHFEIAIGPNDARLVDLAAEIRRQDELPGSGVGVTA